MNSCEFCESIKKYKTIYTNDENLKHEFNIGLIINTWTNANKRWRNSSRVTDLRKFGYGYKLNYCPECGRKIL